MSCVLYPTKPVRAGQHVMNQRQAGLTTFPHAIGVCNDVNSVRSIISVHKHVDHMGHFWQYSNNTPFIIGNLLLNFH